MAGEESDAPVSLIVTVRNDRQGFAELLDALTELTEMPDEIVIVDGGSDDGTLQELAHRQGALPPVRVVVAPGTNIAAGRTRGQTDTSYSVFQWPRGFLEQYWNVMYTNGSSEVYKR